MRLIMWKLRSINWSFNCSMDFMLTLVDTFGGFSVMLISLKIIQLLFPIIGNNYKSKCSIYDDLYMHGFHIRSKVYLTEFSESCFQIFRFKIFKKVSTQIHKIWLVKKLFWMYKKNLYESFNKTLKLDSNIFIVY